jgi:gliotoxin/aspirochlorine/mycotoxins biosynthesis cytochrome P450 monooxygenase
LIRYDLRNVRKDCDSSTTLSVLTRPEHVQAVFRDSDKHNKAVDNNSGFFMKHILGQCVGLVSSTKWRTLRAATEIPFLHKALGSLVPLVQRRTKKYFDEICAASNQPYWLLDPVVDVKMLPFWIIAEVIRPIICYHGARVT